METLCARAVHNKMKRNPNVKVINVLDEKYFNDCHIAGSLNVPLKQLEAKAETWDKKTEIVVYCKHKQSMLSKEACNILIKMGFKYVFDYKEGLRDWLQRGFPTEEACQMTYLK